MSISMKQFRENRPVPGVVQLSDVALNDSSKDFVVPAGVDYRILSGQVNYVSTATAGLRQLQLVILDESSNEVYKSSAGTTQNISLTVDYMLVPGGTRETTVVNGELELSLPVDCVALSGYTIRVQDAAAIDAAADDMTVRILVDQIDR
jgi:hypothetical protein